MSSQGGGIHHLRYIKSQHHMYSSKMLVALLAILVLLHAQQSCPQLCHTNCSSGNCTACFSDFALGAPLSTTCACPTSTFLHISSGICMPCPITCQTCSTYSTCLTCIPGFLLSNNFKCIPGKLNANGWVSKDVVYDLTGIKSPGNSISVFVNNSLVPITSNNSFMNNCSKLPGYNWLGGYGAFGYTTKIVGSLLALSPHQWLNVRFQAVIIDKWIGNTLLLEVSSSLPTSTGTSNAATVWQATYVSQMRFVDFCGNSSIADNLATVDAWIPHNLSSAYIRIRLNQSDTPFNASSSLNQAYLAIRELYVRVGTCGNGCRYCSSPSQCTECILPYILSNGSCICDRTFGFPTPTGCQSNCLSGFYYNTSANHCLNCELMLDNCQTCNSTTCLTCSLGYFYSNSGNQIRCVKYCPDTYTESRTTNVVANKSVTIDMCVPCPSNCKTCNYDICIFCVQGFTYHKNVCMSSCPLNLFARQGSCLRCPTNCLNCTSTTSCSICASGYAPTANGTCSPYCYNTSVFPNTANGCNYTCFSNCSSCFGPSQGQCLACSIGFLQMGQCVSECYNGFFQQGNQCLQCPLECSTCLNSQRCLACSVGNYLVSSSSNRTGCVRLCPSAYYPSNPANTVGMGQCLPCQTGCRRCKDANFCMQCSQRYYHFNLTCIQSPPPSYYFDIKFSHFKPCQPNCLKCDGLVCSLCASGYFLDQGTCVTDCGPNKIKVLRTTSISSRNDDDDEEEDSDDGHNRSYTYNNTYNSTQNGFCEWKSPKCEVYDYTKFDGSCAQCSNFQPSLVMRNTVANGSSCFFNCPEFYVKTNTCVACPQNCRRCNSDMRCFECLYNYVINHPDFITSSNRMTQTCRPNYCPDNYFSDSLQCQQCAAGCITCQIDGRCLRCKDGYQISNDKGTCYPSNCTSTQYYASGQTQCTACISPCLTCLGGYVCTSCISNSTQPYYLFNGDCRISCPEAYFPHKESKTCRKCNPKCATCLNFYNCLTCVSNFYLLSFYNEDQAQCVAECPIGFYSNTTTCQSCNRDCKSCYGPSQYQCLTCYPNFVLDEGKCVYQCANGKYVDQFGHCDWCDSSCNECRGPTMQNCVSCGLGFYISDHQCFKDECPDATYLAHFNERICDRCQFGCSNCSSPQFCRFCFPGYHLYRGWCYKDCPGNLVQDTKWFIKLGNKLGYICRDCLSSYTNCKRCNKKSCTKCASGFFLYRNQTAANQCITVCPAGTYVKSNEARECIACQPYCTNCTSYQNCLKCASPYNLINGYCSNTCPAGTYLTAYQNCSTCPNSCATCTNASSCSSCLPNLYLFANSSGNTCVTTCLQGYFADARSGWCSRCLSTCTSCIATNNCTQCASGYSLSNGVCQNQTTCSSLPNCQLCNSQSCLKCVQPYLLYINRATGISTCVSTCPAGYYSNVFTCELCNSSCTACSNTPNSCSQCQNGLYLYGERCVAICPVGFFADNTLKTCQSCPSNCLNCQQSTCYACKAAFFLYQGQCYSTCPSTTYSSVGMGICYDCPSNCTSCLGDENCTGCISGTWLYNGSCIDSCPMTTYNSTDLMGKTNCQPCISPCYTCNDQDTCISCIPNYILNGTVCQQACNVGFYYLTLTISYDGQDQSYNFTNFTQCYPCSAACSVCSTSADDCQACNDPYILYGGKCLAKCPPATFFVSNSCVSCSSGCLSCNSSAACQVCANNTVLYLGQCISSCPVGFFAKIQANSTQNQYVCQPCSSDCRTCDGPSLYECLSCNNNTYLSANGDCLSTCPMGTYVNTITQSCILCPYGCSECTSPNNCSSCINNYTLTSTRQCKTNSYCNATNCKSCSATTSSVCVQCLPNYYLYNSTCTTTCPTSTFALNGQCYPCSSNCLTCSNVACTSCTNSTFLYQGKCVISCPVGTNPTTAGVCQNDPCLVRNSVNYNCLQCAPPYLLVNQSTTVINLVPFYLSVCVLNCPTGFVQSGSSCAPCSQNCLSCVSATICSNCIAGTYLYQGSCVALCPLGTYPTDSSCQTCSLPYCSQCVSTNGTQTCTSCTNSSGAYLVNGNCVFVCPSGTYRDTVSQNCLSCSSNCVSCTNSQTCLNCSLGYLLYLGQCVTTCPSGTFSSNTTCNPCSVGCLQCFSSSYCSLCQSQYSLLAGISSSSCVSTCPAGYFSQAALSTAYSNSNQFKCVACSSPCLTCTSTSTTCTQCITGYSLSGTVCMNGCPSGSYMGAAQSAVINGVTYATSACYRCSSPCLTCYSTSTYCLSCSSGYILDGSNCVSNCASPTAYYSQTTRMCSNCSQQCYSCYGPGTDNCISCRPPLQLYAASCLSNCPYGYYSTSSFVCQACASSCLTCFGSATNCTSCTTGLYLQIINGLSTCSSTCPYAYYLDATASTCLSCYSPCLTCSNANQCLSCITGYYLFNQACILACPPANAPAFSTTGQAVCSPCPNNCLTCASTAAYQALACTECSTGFYLVNGACSRTCPIGTYASPTSYSCTDCGITGCQTCVMDTTFTVSCSLCSASYFFYNGACVSSCPNGTIPSGSSCVPQPVCQGYQWNGYCLPSCPTGTFPTTTISALANTTAFTCTNCSAFCTACTSSTSCSSCANNTYLYFSANISSCVSTCPSSTYFVSSSCQPCPAPCLTCQPSLTGIACVTCLPGYLQLGSSCYTACPSGYFQSGSQCSQCSSICSSCIGNASNCLECKNTNAVAPSCMPRANCSSFQYASSNTSCSSCNSACLTCYGSASYECLSCANSSNILISGSCTANCPSGSVRNGTACVTCPSNCLNCIISGSSLACNSCASPFILFSSSAAVGVCVQSCSSLNSGSQSYVLVNGQCQLCTIAGCTLCSYTNSQFQCNICQNGTYLYNQACRSVCPAGTMTSGSTCTSCPQNCQYCSTTGCTSCYNGTYYQNGNCVSSCGSASYPLNGVCNPCNTINCLTCNSSSCLSCQQPYLLENGQCNSCVSGYFMSSSVCQACLSPCLTCLGSSTTCTSCISGFLLFNSTTCVSACPSGYYAVTSGSCNACNFSNCQTCTSTSCTTCMSGYVLVGTQSCQISCPSNMYLRVSTNSCMNCSASCSSCTSSTNCLTCINPYVLSQGYCLSSCPSGMYNSNSTCTTCPSGCKTCTSNLACTSCNSGLTLSTNGTCSVPPSNCTTGYFRNNLNGCSQCYSTCLTCSAGGANNCLTCFSGYNITNGVCVQYCSANSYYNANNTCQLCNSTFTNCISCTSSACLACSTNYTVLNGNCTQTCPAGTYLSNNNCLSCPAYCLSCTSSSNCNQCLNTTLLFISGLCYTSCPPQTYFANNACASCYQTCLTCTGSPTNCSSCITPYNLNGNNCTSVCPTGTYSSNYVCQVCSTNCLACSGLSACSQCSSSFYLINGTCRSNCPSGYYIDSASNRCLQCISPCLVCTSRTVCTSCQSPSTLSNGVCINSNCTAGYYDFSLSACVNCTINHCGYCSNTSCSSCITGYYSIYMNGVFTYCEPACIAGTFADNATMNCSNCFTNCFSCINSTWCNMCNSGYYVLSIAGANANECVTVCPYGYYQNNSNYQCSSCPSNCLSCSNQFTCIVCSSYYYQFISNGSVSCVSNCPDMYYTPTVVDGTGQCGPCGTNCYACVDGQTCSQCLLSSYVIVSGTCTPYNCVNCFICNNNNNTCAQCLSTHFLFNNGCLASCPDSYYGDNSTRQCLPCVENCLLCEQANSCLLCISGYVFVNGSSCENAGFIEFGVLGNMSGFTSNITRIMAIVYVSTSSGPIAFGAIGSTYGPMQFCQFIYLLQGSSGGNEEMNNFLNSLSAVSYTSNSGTNDNNQTASSTSSSQPRLLTAIDYNATFLETNLPIFLIMAGFIGAYIMVLLMERYSASCCGTCPTILKYFSYICQFMKQRFKFIYVDTVMWISYLPFLYFAVLQLKSGKFDSGMQIFSSLLAIVIIIIYPLYPVFILRKIFDRSDNEAEDLRNYKAITLKEPPRPEEEGKSLCADVTCCAPSDPRISMVEMSLSPYIDKVVRPIFNQYDHEHPQYSEFRYFKLDHWRLAYAPIKYVRKFIYVMIVALCTNPVATLSLLIVVTCAYMVYLIVLKPKEKLYLVLQIILESVLLFFITFMLIYVTQGGASVSSLSIVTHAIGFLIANSTLAIAIILNLMAYYTIFCCIYDLIKHLKDRAIEDDLKEKAFQEIVDDKEKVDIKDKEKEEIDIRKSIRRGDDEMTVENNEEDHYVQYDLDEKEFNVRDSMIKKKKTFEDEEPEEDFTNLKSTKNPKARNHRRDRKKSSHRLEEESHTSQEMGQSKIMEQDISDGLIKDRNSKYRREVNKNDVNIDRGQLRQPTDKFRKKNHRVSQPQEQQSLEVLRPDKRHKDPLDELVDEIETHDRMVPNKKLELGIDPNFVQRQSKRREKKSEENYDIPQANTRQRQGGNKQPKSKDERNLQDGNMVNRDRRRKEDPYGFNDPSDPANAKAYDRQGKRNKAQVGSDEIEDMNTFNRNNNKTKDNMLDANTYERKGDRRGQNEKDAEEANMRERNKKQQENPFGQFDQMFANEDAQAIRDAQMQERKKKEKDSSLSNQKLVSGFLAEGNTFERKNQPKRHENPHYKGSEEEEVVQEGQAVQAKNKFRRNVKNSEKNIPEGNINAIGKDINTKKVDRMQSNKQFVEDTLEQGKYKERQGKDINKIKSMNEKAEQGIQQGLAYNREKKVSDRKKLEEQKVQSGNLLSPSPVKPKKKPNVYDDLAEDLSESVEFKEEKKMEKRLRGAVEDEDFEESTMGKVIKGKTDQQKRARDSKMQVSSNLQESYEDTVKKNKDQVFKPVMGNKSNLIELGEDDQFEQVSYSRPESKIQRPKSRSKDMGLGVNSRAGSEASDNESRDIRKQRNSAIQRQRKKGTLNVNDKEQNEDDMNVGSDSRRISRIKKQKSKVVKGVLNIDDKSENEDIEDLQF